MNLQTKGSPYLKGAYNKHQKLLMKNFCENLLEKKLLKENAHVDSFVEWLLKNTMEILFCFYTIDEELRFWISSKKNSSPHTQKDKKRNMNLRKSLRFVC